MSLRIACIYMVCLLCGCTCVFPVDQILCISCRKTCMEKDIHSHAIFYDSLQHLGLLHIDLNCLAYFSILQYMVLVYQYLPHRVHIYYRAILQIHEPQAYASSDPLLSLLQICVSSICEDSTGVGSSRASPSSACVISRCSLTSVC